jgi:TPR repeat protein
MSSSTDELSQYAPRWAREGIARHKQNPSLPPAPQLVMPPDDDDPPVPGRTAFNGDVRAWRNSAVAPIEQDEFDLIVTDTPSYRRKGFDERLFKTAAVASFAVIAMELIAFALFPNTVRDLFESHGPSWSAASSTASATAQQNYASTAPASQSDTPDSRSVEAAATESTTGAVSGPVLTRIPTPAVQTAEQAPQAPTETPAPPATSQTADRASLLPTVSVPPASQPADAMYVVTSAEPAAPPKQPDLSQAAQPHTVKLERYSLTQSGQPQGAQTSTVQTHTAAVQTPAVQTSAPQTASIQTPTPQTPPVQTAAVQAAPASQTPAVQALAPQKTQANRNFSADEIDRMVSRGEAFLAQGDVSAARVVLVRAAEARDPRAALALGSTYDPMVLQRMGAVGIKPDPEKAHFWYERAAEFGSGEAGKRLTALAQLAR